MPSITHESLVALFRDCPSLAPEVLRRAGTPLDVPPGSTARVTSAELTDLRPAEYRADVVVVCAAADDPDAAPSDAIIVEVQLARDADKRKTWPVYMTGVRARLGCPATVLVITLDPGVATWCAEPIPLDRNGSVMRPLVLGPAQLPRITDLAQARALPELAVLSSAAHGHDDDAATIALAALGACRDLDSGRASRYSDFIVTSLGEAARRALKELLTLPEYPYQTDFARKHVAEGRAQGQAQGQAQGRRDVLLMQLAQRFGEVPEPVRKRVEQAELDDLDRWTSRIIPAATLADVFDGE